MEEEVVVDQQGPLQICIGHPRPEDRAPKCRACNALNDSFLHAFSVYHKSAEHHEKRTTCLQIGLDGIRPVKGRLTMVLLHGDGSCGTTLHTEAALDAA